MTELMTVVPGSGVWLADRRAAACAVMEEIRQFKPGFSYDEALGLVAWTYDLVSRVREEGFDWVWLTKRESRSAEYGNFCIVVPPRQRLEGNRYFYDHSGEAKAMLEWHCLIRAHEANARISHRRRSKSDPYPTAIRISTSVSNGRGARQ